MVERIIHDDVLLAIILRATDTFHENEGIEFYTHSAFSQQLGLMRRKKNHVITPHLHKPVPRTIDFTKEVLFIRYGLVKVDFYSERKEMIATKQVGSGDCILLARGGHGFTMLEDSEIIEVKQGPYAGDEDKERF